MDRDQYASEPLLGSGAAAGQLQQQQQQLAGLQRQQLDRIGASVGTLRSMSHQIGAEVDAQTVLIEDVSQDVDAAQGRIDTALMKMAKVLRMTDDRRQWTIIVTLSGVLFVIILLFFVL